MFLLYDVLNHVFGKEIINTPLILEVNQCLDYVVAIWRMNIHGVSNLN